MDPRISFSNDFVDNNNNNNNLLTAMQIKKHEAIYREAPVSSDFEFSVKNYSMRSADEIMFQGMLLPSMKNNSSRNSNNNLLQQQQIQKKNTLKDELLVDHDDDEDDDDVDDYGDIFSRPPKSLARWKERFGLKKSNILGRKIKTTSAANAAAAIDHHMVFDAAFTTKQNQEKVIFEGGLKCIENNAM